uniref:U-box domain-containing protein n=1 Tax=Lotharella globosa TaxID=91324 RepID=A0A7S3YZD4_9EUKA
MVTKLDWGTRLCTTPTPFTMELIPVRFNMDGSYHPSHQPLHPIDSGGSNGSTNGGAAAATAAAMDKGRYMLTKDGSALQHLQQRFGDALAKSAKERSPPCLAPSNRVLPSMNTMDALGHLMALIDTTRNQLRKSVDDMKVDKEKLENERLEIAELLEEAKTIRASLTSGLELAQRTVVMAYQEKRKVREQVDMVLEGLKEKREREEEWFRQQNAEMESKEKEMSLKHDQIRSDKEDLDAASNAFEVKKAAFELQMSEESKALKRKMEVLESKRALLKRENGKKKKKKPQNTAKIPPSYFCPITFECMKDPVITADGYSYERGAIQEWIDKHRGDDFQGIVSPQTGLPLSNRHAMHTLTPPHIQISPENKKRTPF